MIITPLKSAGALFGLVLFAFASGCSNGSQGTPSTYIVNATPGQIAAIQSDPNIPAARKAGIIAALKGDRTYQSSAPPTAGAPNFTKSRSAN